MTVHPFGRRRPPVFNGDFPDGAEPVTRAIDRVSDITPDWDARTTRSGPAAIIYAIKQRGQDTEPIARYRPGPPAAGPRTQVLPPVPVTEPAVIGDSLRLPVAWCAAAACISWHHDPQALGERDARDRAIAAGWRTDALGRLYCPACQQRDPAFQATQPATWYHPEVHRRFVSGEPLTRTDMSRLDAEVAFGRRVSLENPALARDIADATARHESRQR